MHNSKDATAKDITPIESGDSKEEEINEDAGEIVVDIGRIPSPLEESLFDFGKDIIKSSIAQSLEFHKTMLGLTTTFTTLMASTYGILAFGLKDQRLDDFQRIFLVIPVFLMLLSSICFAIGYYPRRVKVQLQILSIVEAEREKLLRTRRHWAFYGIFLFIFAILSLLVGMIFFNTI